MNEESIKNFLTTCVYQEMNSFHQSQDEDYNHEFSKKFMKRWKRLNWSEKYFGSHLRLAYTVRKAAAVVIVILSLAAANQVSAKVFGFNAWKYLLSYDSKNKLEVREYVGQNQDKKTKESLPDVIHEKPTFVPKGFRYYSHDELSSGNALYDEWRDGKKNTLQYSRGKVREGDQIYTDSEYEQKLKTSVMGYEAYYYIKGNEEWIMWDDKEYNYMILLIKKGNYKAELLKMANSLYQK